MALIDYEIIWGSGLQPQDAKNNACKTLKKLRDKKAFNCKLCNLRFLHYYRSCGQSGDYPIRQIYKQEIDSKHWALLKPKKSRATHRQEDHKQR
jgi:hypothetical protein